MFKYIIILFELYNAPAIFQAFINKTLCKYLDTFCTAYLNNILIYSNSMDEYIGHVQKVLNKLFKAGLFLDINKCDFYIKEVKYLGLIITTEGLKMDPKKIKIIIDWKTSYCVKDVQAFLSFTNFYRRFIRGYLKIAALLINLIKTNSLKPNGVKVNIVFLLTLDRAEEKAFQTLKEVFIKAPVLAYFDPDQETWVEINILNYITTGVLS